MQSMFSWAYNFFLFFLLKSYILFMYLIPEVTVHQDLSTVYLPGKNPLNPLLPLMLLDTQTCSILKELSNHF